LPNNYAVRTTSDGRSFDYDAHGNQTLRKGPGIPHERQKLEYTAFDLPRRIEVGPEQAPVEEHAFAYDATNRRVAHDVKRTAGSDAPSLESTIYVGAGYERTRIDGIDRHVTRVMAPDGTTISIEQVEGADAAVRYNFTDRLGSVYAVTDENGVILEKRGYRPFGDESRSAGLGETTGFTGHEQDRDLGLINMGGRMYDPSLGRFLTADPVIADPMHSLSFNAYSYVNNRPLDFTDPSGFQAADVAPPPPPPPPPPAPLPGDPWVYVETGTWVPDDSSGTRSQRSSGGATAQQAAPAPASGESKGAINAGAQSAAAGPASSIARSGGKWRSSKLSGSGIVPTGPESERSTNADLASGRRRSPTMS
jgi:RHS repeat-associated protein